MSLEFFSFLHSTFFVVLRSSSSSRNSRSSSSGSFLGDSFDSSSLLGVVLLTGPFGAETGLPVLLGPGLRPGSAPDDLGDLLDGSLGHRLGPRQLGRLGGGGQAVRVRAGARLGGLALLLVLLGAAPEAGGLLELGGGGRGLGGGGLAGGLLGTGPQELGGGRGGGEDLRRNGC